MKKPKVNKKEEKKYYGYGVEIHQTCIESYRSPEQYGDWRESYDNRCGDVVRRDAQYPDVVSIYDIPAGEDAWVVWAEYSSGDSFGHSTRGYTEVIGIFRKQDYDSAESLQRSIEIANREHDRRRDSNGYRFETPDGQVFESGFAPWYGYFDSLDSVNIDRVHVARSRNED